MRAVILLLPQPPRAWHGDLCRRLRASGFAVAIRQGAPAMPAWTHRSLLGVEAVLGRRSEALRPLPLDTLGPGDAPSDALRIVLDGSLAHPGEIVALFDSLPGEHRLLASLAAGGRPRIAVARVGEEGLSILGEAAPALADPALLSRSLDDCYDRLAVLLVAALAGSPHHPLVHPVEPRAPSHRPGGQGRISRRLAGKLWGRVLGRQEHWRIHARDPAGRTFVLADDGRRYYADPFPLMIEDRLHVFFEDLDLASRRGVISASVLGPDGFSPPRTVLSRPYHLSYPQVFAVDGEIFMLPESSGTRRLELWRARRVPDCWLLDSVLLDGPAVADATLVQHGGLHWIFAASAEPGGTSWDRLLLFHAPTLRGPWRAHRHNPILVDAAAARPAGSMWHEGSTLMRVAMDCRGGYGDGVNVLRVDRLDPDGFRQVLVNSLPLPAGADGLHTLNRFAGYEFVDLRSHAARRFRRGARGLTA